MSQSLERERKPYNPYHLAGGYAAQSLPDKKTAAVFARLCNHTDFMGGSVSASVNTIAKETRYSPRAVNYAFKVLKALGRISRKQRAIGGQRGGRKSCITTVHCTEAELRAAGANEENYFGRGGTSGLTKVQSQPPSKKPATVCSTTVSGSIKTQNAPNQNAKRVYSKRKSDVFKTQRSAQEPLSTEPFLPEPIKSEPLQAKDSDIFSPTKNEGKTKTAGQTTALPETTATALADSATARPAGERHGVDSAPPPNDFLSKEAAAKLTSFGCPQEVIAEITKLHLWSKALNNTTNVVSSYETLAMKGNETAIKLFKMWMPQRIHEKISGIDDDSDFEPMTQAEREYLLKEGAKPAAQRLLESAKEWWNLGFDGPEGDARRHELVDFPVGHRTHWKVADEQVVAAYQTHLEGARKREHETLMRKCTEAAARKAKAVSA